jgi:hypothetical protein
MFLRVRYFVAILLVALAPTLLAAQSPSERPHRGFFGGIRVGVGFGRATCDSPCYSPRARFGPSVTYIVGHTVGDRSTAGVTFGQFSGRFSSPRDVWSLGGLGLEAGMRPSATSKTIGSMALGFGSWEREPKRGGHGATATVAQWRFGIAYDDPTTSTWGAQADLYGSLGGAISRSPGEDGSRVSAIGLSVGPTYVRR